MLNGSCLGKTDWEALHLKSENRGSVSKSGKSAEFSSKEFNFGSATGTVASLSSATASSSNEDAVASATLGYCYSFGLFLKSVIE
ncbi:hypothetical protein [Crinalium epipsammum]|uniref:hypothetical protein n=1 Tax=Crinalium epipsammum TaxID=241425 RepID=UPI00059CE205|nr:hypothetical protein [Crinalium epipsammum]